MTFFNISALKEAIDAPGLLRGSETLKSVENLRVPQLSKTFLKSEVGDEQFDQSTVEWQNGATFPGALGPPFFAIVHSTEEISNEADVHKPKFEIQVAFNENEPFVRHFEAGDAFYVVCPNADVDVEFVLSRLDLTPKADMELRLEKADPNGERELPDYIPPLCSIRHLLTYCLDIRRVPSRPVIRALAEYCHDPDERRRLLELCSVDGTKEFSAHVQAASISLIDLLIHFDSCAPPIERLVEILPRLLPRAYTVSSWDLYEKNRFRFVVSLMKTKGGQNGVMYTRYGLCSGYLKSLLNGDSIQLIAKEPSKFRFPLKVKPSLTLDQAPIVMFGPGTGVAPFIAFLERFRELDQLAEVADGEQPTRPRRCLFYGSRDLEKEFVFKEDMERLKKDGTLTDLFVCESKVENEGTDRPRYIYDALRAQPDEFFDFLFFSEPQPFIFACGDVKLLSRQLWECLTAIISERKGITKPEAVAILKRLREQEFFIEDTWS
ncbi:Methionine synthase reductase [Aphelenchoides fujianensis]|nr:Methionine synthase reductase [Aphelenchoides fujianensis]